MFKKSDDPIPNVIIIRREEIYIIPKLLKKHEGKITEKQ